MPLESEHATQATELRDAPTRDLPRAERRRLAQVAQLKKLIRRHYLAQRRYTDRKRSDSDFFVVAKYEMPLSRITSRSFSDMDVPSFCLARFMVSIITF